MLNTVYKDAIINRDKMLSILKGPKFEEIIKKARENWVEFTPEKEEVVTAGIDSSFNNTKFQGIELWATTAVSIKSDGEVLVDLHESGLGSDNDLSRIASKMEIDACEKTVDQVDLVLMDGSLHSQFMTRQSTLDALVVKTMKKRNNVIFIAKTSNTKKQFEKLGSLAGDIFYYNHVTNKPGFSKIFVEKKYGSDKIISSTFVRLSDSTPIIKLEFLGGDYDESFVKSTMNKLYKTSIGGYPYALKLAHNNCKISDKELSKMVSLLGLSNEIGSKRGIRLSLGFVIGESKPTFVTAITSRALSVGEYIKIGSDEGEILGLVERSSVSSAAFTDVRNFDEAAESTEIAELNKRDKTFTSQIGILGFLENLKKGQSIIPAIPPIPGTEIVQPTNQDLEEIFSPKNNGWVKIGNLLRNKTIDAKVNLDKIVSRHLGILQ